MSIHQSSLKDLWRLWNMNLKDTKDVRVEERHKDRLLGKENLRSNIKCQCVGGGYMYNTRLYTLCAGWEVHRGGIRRVYSLTQLWVCWVIASLCLNVKCQVPFFNWAYLVMQNCHLPSSLKENAHGRRIRFKPQELIKVLFPISFTAPPLFNSD